MGAEESGMTSTEIAAFKHKFSIADSTFETLAKSFKKHCDKTGKVSRPVFIKVLENAMPEELANKVFDSFDRDHSGWIDVREYLTLMGVIHGKSIEAKLNASFDMFDANGDGSLSKEEVTQMFMMMVRQKRKAQNLPDTIDAKAQANIQKTVDNVFAVADKDKNGTISREEFTEGFLTRPDVCTFFRQF
eukprot:TRINITY_DN1128_c1_g1_i2.p1 TRINITY_DN1128_c1_g1~~TRINITY_DN1128_c1_g1_i2.p1  ORF type:complete len:189 (-),score=53.27 TRINITY_DN1128_c1_g1_i2:117-683(-)